MSTIFHRIKAVLLPNRFTGAEKDEYHARVLSERTLDTASVCQSAVERGQVTGTVNAMAMHVDQFFKEMSFLLKDGYSVNTGYFKVVPQIRGTFTSETDSFDPARHSLYFHFKQGELLRKDAGDLEVVIAGMAKHEIEIDRVVDVKTKSINHLITSGHTIRIQGERLKLAGEDPSVGIYLIHESTAELTAIDASDILCNTPRELIVHLPALPPGGYLLQITSQYSTGRLLKQPRTTVFDQVLTVC